MFSSLLPFARAIVLLFHLTYWKASFDRLRNYPDGGTVALADFREKFPSGSFRMRKPAQAVLTASSFRDQKDLF